MVQDQSCKGFAGHRIRGRVSRVVVASGSPSSIYLSFRYFFQRILYTLYHSFCKKRKMSIRCQNGGLRDGEVMTLYNVTEENCVRGGRAKLIANVALQVTEILANGKNRN